MSQRVFRVIQEGSNVTLVLNGCLVAELPWEAALEVSRAIHAKAKEAESYAKVHEIIADQALVLANGLPFGLTNDRRVMREAIKEASAFGGVKSKSIVGTPAVLQS